MLYFLRNIGLAKIMTDHNVVNLKKHLKIVYGQSYNLFLFLHTHTHQLSICSTNTNNEVKTDRIGIYLRYTQM